MKVPSFANFRCRATSTWAWFIAHPTAFINLLLGLIALVFFVYLATKPIDVLEDWGVSTTKHGKAGEMPIYYPGGTLEFVSESVKLIPAVGETVRIFDCDATSTQPAREIQLDKLSANRPPGNSAPRENSIIVPSVLEFNGLPRVCRIIFNITYTDVILWRDHPESTRTNDFLVQEEPITPENLRREIDELKRRQQELEAKQLVYERSPARPNVVERYVADRSTVAAAPSQSPANQPSPAPSPSPSLTPTAIPTPRPCAIGLLGLCILGAR